MVTLPLGLVKAVKEQLTTNATTSLSSLQTMYHQQVSPSRRLAVFVAARRERDRETTKAYSPDLIACEYRTQRTLYNQHRRYWFAQYQ